jgi:heme exporter protein C
MLVYLHQSKSNYNMIKGLWWKALGALIFVYVLIGGMTVPLKSGLTNVSPTQANAGDTLTLFVNGYNTHFKSVKANRAWLKLDSTHYIAGKTFESSNDQLAKISFLIPTSFPTKDKVVPMTLIIDNELDGAFVSPNVVFVTQMDSILTEKSESWTILETATLNAVAGVKFPYRNILHETIRNTFFHVALWFAMFVLLIIGLIHAIKYLISNDLNADIKSASYNRIAIMYGILGIITGSIWAKFTWNTFWTTDVKLNMSAIAMLIYLAYLILRNTTMDFDRRAKLSASYTIFAFCALIPLIFVIPRMTDSLHPGNGGNPALGGEDLDNTLRLFFYPSIIALILLGLWMSQLLIRYEKIKEKVLINKQ